MVHLRYRNQLHGFDFSLWRWSYFRRCWFLFFTIHLFGRCLQIILQLGCYSLTQIYQYSSLSNWYTNFTKFSYWSYLIRSIVNCVNCARLSLVIPECWIGLMSHRFLIFLGHFFFRESHSYFQLISDYLRESRILFSIV